MKLRSGKEKIADYKEIPLLVDWNDLLYFKGNQRVQESGEHMLSRVLVGISSIVMILFVVIVLSSGRFNELQLLNPTTILEMMPWLSVLLWSYSRYLGRNRDQFDVFLELRELPRLMDQIDQGQVKEIELESYFSHELQLIIDELYFHNYDDFAKDFFLKLASTPELQSVINRVGLEVEQIKTKLDSYHEINPKFDLHYKGLFPAIFNKAVELEMNKIESAAVLLVMMETVWRQVFLDLGVADAEMESLSLWLRNEYRKRRYNDIWKRTSLLKPTGVVNRAYTSRYAATLEQYGYDFTAGAAKGDFALTIGRDAEMHQLIQALNREGGGAAILIGEPGVGKSRFLRHLAVRMVVEDVPPSLKDQRLVSFNFNKAFAENQTLENFKLTLEQLFEQIAETKNVILVLDDMDQMLNIRKDMQAEISNMIIGAIDKYKIRLIGTSGKEGYTRHIKSIRPLASLLRTIDLPEPSSLIAMQILTDEVPRLEAKYGITVQIDAIRTIVSLAPKFAHERAMPDKAIDLLSESLVEAQSMGARWLSSDIVSSVISRKVGVNVGDISQAESETLINLEAEMHKRVIGQDTAIKAIAAALRRSRAGLKSGHKPIASFLFFGPTGVGKTEVAKTLAATYYGDEKLMTRIDMSEYQEEKNLQRLIGYMDGDKFVGGYLTEAVRSRPFSLLLLDEMEKANPKVLDLFLQVLDEGFLTDGAGRKIDFSNNIIIATSNAGSRQIAEQIGEGMTYAKVNEQSLPKLREVFRVEFLNRFDKVIMFKPLMPHEVEEIAGHVLAKVDQDLLERGIRLEYTQKVLEGLVDLGYNPIYGAREIQRVVREQLEDKIAEEIVRGNLRSGKTIRFLGVENYEIL